MSQVKRVSIIALGLVIAAASLSAQSTKLVGTWKFNGQKSKMVSGPAPREITRTYEDRGNGTYAYTQVTISAEGARTETRYTAREDGSENEMFRVGPANALTPAGTISFVWTDAYSANQTQTGSGFVVNAVRTLSADGKTLTITIPSNAGQLTGAPPPPDVVVFDKQ